MRGLVDSEIEVHNSQYVHVGSEQYTPHPVMIGKTIHYLNALMIEEK
jgi:hypothetical protein